VYEDFEKDIYGALEEALPHVQRYHTVKLIFPEYTYYPEEIVKGFTSFCQQYAFNYKIVHSIEDEPINEGEVFINLMDNDLVVLIERIIELNFEVGKNVGVISYNETPLKKIILKGITTISTDFEAMGAEAAHLIQNNTLKHVAIPFSLRLRASI
jgi:DNA-binding LacI/PurR family transcriptional regulator